MEKEGRKDLEKDPLWPRRLSDNGGDGNDVQRAIVDFLKFENEREGERGREREMAKMAKNMIFCLI